VALPSTLRSLLLETDGVQDCFLDVNGQWRYDMYLPWSSTEIIEENEDFRSDKLQRLYPRNFKNMLFFASAGADGILFGFQVLENRMCDTSVMVWDPIPNEWRISATDLKTFIEGWLTSKISV
jgi:hypothetical protein